MFKPSTKISKFYALTDSERKFNKMGIENWVPIDWEPAVITTALCPTANEYSLKVLYLYSKVLMRDNPLTSLKLQVFSNPTPITQSSISPR